MKRNSPLRHPRPFQNAAASLKVGSSLTPAVLVSEKFTVTTMTRRRMTDAWENQAYIRFEKYFLNRVRARMKIIVQNIWRLFLESYILLSTNTLLGRSPSFGIFLFFLSKYSAWKVHKLFLYKDNLYYFGIKFWSIN
jgi:hypothetical protein